MYCVFFLFFCVCLYCVFVAAVLFVLLFFLGIAIIVQCGFVLRVFAVCFVCWYCVVL